MRLSRLKLRLKRKKYVGLLFNVTEFFYFTLIFMTGFRVVTFAIFYHMQSCLVKVKSEFFYDLGTTLVRVNFADEKEERADEGSSRSKEEVG